MRELSNIQKAVKYAESKGFREYTPSGLESYQKAWQFKIDDNEFVNVNFYDHASVRPDIDSLARYGIEIMHYYEDKLCARKDLYYAFKDLNFFKKVINRLLEI